jgi:hypothetical protein
MPGRVANPWTGLVRSASHDGKEMRKPKLAKQLPLLAYSASILALS